MTDLDPDLRYVVRMSNGMFLARQHGRWTTVYKLVNAYAFTTHEKAREATPLVGNNHVVSIEPSHALLLTFPCKTRNTPSRA